MRRWTWLVAGAWVLAGCAQEGRHLVRTKPYTEEDIRWVVDHQVQGTELVVAIEEELTTRQYEAQRWRSVSADKKSSWKLKKHRFTATMLLGPGLGSTALTVLFFAVAGAGGMGMPPAVPITLGSLTGSAGLGLLTTAAILASPTQRSRHFSTKNVLITTNTESEALRGSKLLLASPSGNIQTDKTDRDGLAHFDLWPQIGESDNPRHGFALLETESFTLTIPSRPDWSHAWVLNTDQTAGIKEQLELLYADPPRLVTTLAFDDEASGDANGVLDALEQATVRVHVKNVGSGPGLDVHLEPCQDDPGSAYSGLSTVDISKELGDLEAGAELTLELPIHTNAQLGSSAQSTLRLCTRESRGYDALPAVLALTTQALRPSKLMVAGLEILDGPTGRSRGNGNNVLENGERAVLRVRVRNGGPGGASQLEAHIDCMPESVTILESEADLMRLPPDASGTLDFLVELPPDFEGPAPKVTIEIVDARGPAAGHVRHSELLSFAYREVRLELVGLTVRDDDSGRTRGDGDGRLENDERVELVLAVENKGDMIARDLEARWNGDPGMASGEIIFGDLAPGEGHEETILVELPRLVRAEAYDLRLELQHAGSSKVQSVSKRVPIGQRRPQLELAPAEVFDGWGDPSSYGDGDRVIEPNETVVVQWRLDNLGDLSAEELQVEFTIPENSGLAIRSEPSSGLSLPAGGSLPLDMLLDVKGVFDSDAILVQVDLTQADFDAIRLQKVLAVGRPEELVTVVQPHIAGGSRFDTEREHAPGAAADRTTVAMPRLNSSLKTGADGSKDHAVVIGIEDYLAVSDVPFASRDAELFANLMEHTRGIPRSRLALLVSPRSITHETIRDRVREAGRATGPEGTVWIYFAGHGGASIRDGTRLLLGDDVRRDPERFEDRGISVDELKDLAGAGGARVVLLVDACYAGKDRMGKEIAPGRPTVPLVANASSNTLEWTATQANETASAWDLVEHGAFTYFAVGALRGWADGALDGKRDGTITAAEAHRYVREALQQVPLTSDQHPNLLVLDPTSWVLMESEELEPGPELRGAEFQLE